MPTIQVIDIVERYDPDTIEEYVCLIGKDRGGGLHYVDVAGTPHECLIAVGEDFTPAQASVLVEQLQGYLCRKHHGCRRTNCEECESQNQGGWGISREPCVRLRRQFIREPIRRFEIVRKRGFSCYEKHDRPFLRVILSHAFLVNKVEEWMLLPENARSFGTVSEAHRGIHECRAKTVDSFLALVNIASFDWISFPDTRRSSSSSNANTYRVHVDQLTKVALEPEVKVKEPVTLFLDIETIAREYMNSKTKRAEYPVGVISVSTSTGEKRSFLLGSAIPSAHVQAYADEADMFRGFYDYFMALDPDIISGYNTNKFDIPYLVRRAARLGVSRFTSLSRFADMPLYIHETSRTTNQAGTQSQTFIDCPGRIFLDLYPMIRKGYKMENYKLSSVAEEFDLGQKGDLAYSELYGAFHGSMERRMELEEYCALDTKLAQDVEAKTGAVRRLMAKCKVLRLRARDALDRGLGYLLSMMVRSKYGPAGYVNKKAEYVYDEETKQRKRVMDACFEDIEGYGDLWDMKERHEKYPGAFVFDPKTGLYEDAVFTLDFNSLYPSVIRTFNVCRSTQLASPEPGSNVSPYGFAYTREKEGIMPQIERELVDMRNEVKAKIEEEKAKPNPDEALLGMYEAEQLEIKVAANSLYGLMGTTTSEFSFLSGAVSITQWGAKYIRRVAEVVQEHFPYAEVVYGDTDSLMIRFRDCRVLADARAKAKEIHAWVNTMLKAWMGEEGIVGGVLKMGAENISMPFLLLEKKKYVKVIYPVDEREDAKLQEKGKWPNLKPSGIETRSSTKYTKDTIREIHHAALIEHKPQEYLIDIIRRRLQALYLGQVPDKTELKHSTNLAQPLEAYKVIDSPHLVAARQMLHDGLELEPGDRVEYYFCDVITDSTKKADLAVAAHLAGQYDLLWSAYVEEVVNALEKTILPLLTVDLGWITNPTTYKKPETRKRRFAPRSGGGGIAKFLVREEGDEEEGAAPGEGEVATASIIVDRGFKQQTIFGAAPPTHKVVKKRKATPKKKSSSAGDRNKVSHQDFFKSYAM